MDKATAQSLKVGDRVATGEADSGDFTSKLKYRGTYGESNVICGKVIRTIVGNKIGVLWDSNYLNHPIYNRENNELLFTGAEVSFKSLFLEKEATDKVSALEKEYKGLTIQAKSKVKEAVKLIREANKIAKKSGGDGLVDMYEVSHDLMSVLDECGWQTSSMGC